MTEISINNPQEEDEGFDLEELMGGKHMDESEDDSTEDDGFDIGELF